MAADDLKTWLHKATAAEFADRIKAEPGFLYSRDSSIDGFGVLHHAAALGRDDLIRITLERGLSIDTPTGTAVRDDNNEASVKFDPGYTPLMCAARHGQLNSREVSPLGWCRSFQA